MVTRALPAVWALISPADALAVREAGAVASLQRLLGLGLGDSVPDHVASAARQLADAAGDLDITGRVLGAANSAMAVPDEPLARLWHAATLLREHRGDGHVAAVVAAGIDGCESVVLRAGVDLATGGRAHVGASAGREWIQRARGWTDADWAAATVRLTERDLLKDAGEQTSPATDEGLDLHRSIEEATDRAAARPWARLGTERIAELAGLLAPITARCAAELPFPNPVGVPAPAAS